jgi:hypothetical protein
LRCLGNVAREECGLRKVRGVFFPGIAEELNMAKKEKMLTAVIRDRAVASQTYDWLQQRGYSTSDINILMSEQSRAAFSEKGTEGKIKSGDKSVEGVAAGGAIGTAVGATIGAILAIGTSVVVPGLGLIVAGPLLAGLAAGGAGAVAGGVVGGLVGLGIPESNAKAYEEALKKGGVVFGVVPHTDEDADGIKKYLEKQGAENIVYTERK